ncbi:probable RNA-dependent RNA polymerase 1 isoform X2 [Macadamia integrifolia]|uniref:probable RNA-dependent RNA polymerase 1 isoform X2 n=1 Tax=Macadamia integrifolia TaxID=60698 RepID=UPI001C52AE92|nr:probable RNA-dependent RNA polymerase 1 isoform X2 [Macadamia integrifolia]
MEITVLKEILMCGSMHFAFRAAKRLKNCKVDKNICSIWKIISHLMFGGNEQDQNVIVKGKKFIAKNPCLHNGDVLVLHAIDVPASHHMADCGLFSHKKDQDIGYTIQDVTAPVLLFHLDHTQINVEGVIMEYVPAATFSLDHDIMIEVLVFPFGMQDLILKLFSTSPYGFWFSLNLVCSACHEGFLVLIILRQLDNEECSFTLLMVFILPLIYYINAFSFSQF